MKYCDVLPGETAGLAAYRLDHPDATDWDTFRHGGKERYDELAEALEKRQRGLCAFCETRLVTDIPTPARQIEHWIPKSNGGAACHEITFGIANLHASCLGGTKTHLPPPFGTHGLPRGENLSCGQKKGDTDPSGFPEATRPYRPTELPLSPPAFTVSFDGGFDASADAIAVGLSPTRLQATITYLGLNCDRLKISRAEVHAYLLTQLADYEAKEIDPDPIIVTQLAMAKLASDLGDRAGRPLPRFISVLRDFFGPAHEVYLLPMAGWANG